LVSDAKKRMAEDPGKYYPRIYGLPEVGGTSVLFLSGAPFEQIGLETNLPHQPLPALTWRVLSLVPDVATVGATLLGGIYWITNRRDEVAKAERRGKGKRS
jgi:formate dehydrogenase iron-sulfur subunit